MLNMDQITTYFKEVAGSIKFQLSSAVTFGVALALVWFKEGNELKIFLTILFLFPICMFVGTVIEKGVSFIRAKIEMRKNWENLTPDESEFISYYLKENTKTRYMICDNGIYKDSGIINPLIHKKILYLASNTSEYRGDHWAAKAQYFPINIHDDAFSHFRQSLKNRIVETAEKQQLAGLE